MRDRVELKQRGFTLTELLVAVAIIAVLLGLLLPALWAVRRSGRSVIVLSDLRSIHLASSVYTEANSGVLPFPSPDMSRPFFSFSESWRVAWGRDHLGENYNARPMVREVPGQDPAPYVWASTGFSEPVFWAEGSTRSQEMLRAQRATRIRFPAAKAMVVAPASDGSYHFVPRAAQHEDQPFFATQEQPAFAFADGSAAAVPKTELLTPDRRGEQGQGWSFWPLAIYGVHTSQGINGRDRR
jgi:prepilin-type N-terminal cleavage/methylation domain-containing protein